MATKKKTQGAEVVEGNLETDFTDDPRNANRGTDRGRKMLTGSATEFGAARSMVADKNGVIVAGNKTRAALTAAGLKKAIVVKTDGSVPVVVQRTDFDASKAKGKARRYAIADNRISEVDLEWNEDEIRALRDDGVDLGDYWSKDELGDLLDESKPIDDTEDEIPQLPVKPVAKLGDVWKLGASRVFCDSARTIEAKRLRLGALGFAFTSPPYNAGDNSLGGNKARKASKYVGTSDAMPEGEYTALLIDATSTMLQACAVAMVNLQMLAGNKRSIVRWSNTFASRLIDRGVWDKGSGTPQMAANVLNSNFEDLWWFAAGENPSRAIATAAFHGNVSNVFRCGGLQKNHGEGDDEDAVTLHAARMPMKLAAWAVQTFGAKADFVVDVFGGSGTTLIAAARADKPAALVELEPAYVDVIVERWQRATGGKAKRA